jgi:uncharacterized protein (DUF2141 family)
MKTFDSSSAIEAERKTRFCRSHLSINESIQKKIYAMNSGQLAVGASVSNNQNHMCHIKTQENWRRGTMAREIDGRAW